MCLWFLLVLGIAPFGHAQVSAVYPWPEQLESAEVSVVCLGTVAGTEISARRGGLAEATVHVSVLRIIKGPATLKQLTFTQVLEQDEPRSSVPADRYSIFFFRGRTDENRFQLFMLHQSIIALGNGVPKPLSAELSPFRTIELLMAHALADADGERRIQLLLVLQDTLFLDHSKYPPTVHLAQKIGEPNGVKQFYDEQIIPLVEPYLHDQSPEVRRIASNIAAHRF